MNMRSQNPQRLIGVLALLAVLSVMIAVGVYSALSGSKDASLDPAVPDRVADSDGRMDNSRPVTGDEILPGVLRVVTPGSDGTPTTVIALEGRERVAATRLEDGIHEFSPPPGVGAQLVAWAGSPESGRTTGVADVVVYDGSEDTVSMPVRPVWPVRVRVTGVDDPPEGGPRLGVRFPTPDMEYDWARMVEIINGVSAEHYMQAPDEVNSFVLPMVPAQVPLQVNAVWGGYSGVTETFTLTAPREITLELARLPDKRLIRVRDGNGAPAIVKLSVTVTLNTGRSSQRVAATGEDGLLEVPMDDAATHRASVRVVDDAWVSPLSSYLLFPGPEILEIQVWRTGVLSLRVQYDDGEPYLGSVSVSAAYTDLGDSIPRGWSGRLVDADTPIVEPKDEYERSMMGDSPSGFHEVITFTGVPLGPDLTVRLQRLRVGYPAHREVIPSAKVEAGEVLLIVIPRDTIIERTLSRIKIPEHLEFADDVYVSIIILTEDGRHAPLQRAFKLSEQRVSRMARPGFRYIVRLSGSVAWQSHEFELPPGTEYEVYPQPGAPVTITARVVNEQGEPIEGATLDVNTIHGPPNPDHRPRISDVVIGKADPDGRVSLVGQPRVKTDFRVEAPGYQPQVITADPGMAVYDLGEVVLKRAVGEIHIRLPKADYQDVFLKADVVQSVSGTLATARAESDVIVFRNLPVGRKYSVSLRSTAGGATKIFNGVEPTEENPVVELDATDLELPGE
jgi:hypothetical protein